MTQVVESLQGSEFNPQYWQKQNKTKNNLGVCVCVCVCVSQLKILKNK
jgi:hypothetical protein